MSKTNLKVLVDRIEGDVAVLVVDAEDGAQFNLPVKYLPEGVKDGSHLRVTFEVDAKSARAAKEKVQDLLKELRGKG
ncbi:MAG TPA: DUF3006 domain-containing protein [Blastocatellia bacterium]|nr:DUF3006 domain-containing protein [Blastocatellia bacterium]